MSNNVNDVLDSLRPLFESTDEALQEWVGTEHLKFPEFLTKLAVKLNWDKDQIRVNDPLIRFFIKNNKEFYLTKGANGGIGRTVDREKKKEMLAAKNSIKKQLKDKIENAD